MDMAQIFKLPNAQNSFDLEILKLKCQINDLENQIRQMVDSNEQVTHQQISIYSDGLSRLIKTDDITMIKSDSNYSAIYLENGEKLYTSKTLKYWESQCSTNIMIRIHHSFMVNKNKIKAINTECCTVILIDGRIAKYSKMSKKNLLSLLK